MPRLPPRVAELPSIRHDLRVLLNGITTTARSRLFLLTTSPIAKSLSVLHTTSGDSAFPTLTYNGGTIGGIEVVVTDGVASGTMLLVDASKSRLEVKRFNCFPPSMRACKWTTRRTCHRPLRATWSTCGR